MTRLIAIAAAALILAGGAHVWQSGQSTSAYPGLGAAAAQTAVEEVDTSIVQEMVLGSPDAPVTVIEYASFTCPYCRSFHIGPFNELKADYIDTGKVRFIYREVYFDRFGLWAGMVARCGFGEDDAAMEEAAAEGAANADQAAAPDAGTRRYFAIADVIYEQQSEWSSADTPVGIAQNLARIGRSAGLGADQVDACLQDAAMAQALVAVYQQNAEADGVRSTPTFIIDGETYSNMPWAEFAAILDEKLGE